MDVFEDSEELPSLDLSVDTQGGLNQHTLPSSLKPKLDLIFSEVEQKLPDIDFELSDVSKTVPFGYLESEIDIFILFQTKSVTKKQMNKCMAEIYVLDGI